MIPIIVVHSVISMNREVDILKKEVIEKTTTIAKITGNSCVADVVLSDKGSTLKNLELLSSNKSIEYISILNANGELFSSFTYHPILKQINPNDFSKSFAVLNNKKVIVNEPIFRDTDYVGSVMIIANNSQLNSAITDHFKSSSQIMIALIIVVVFISFQVHKLISKPILDLAILAETVAKKKDYSIRGNSRYEDEVGTLVAGFNSMLNTIESTTVSKKFVDSVIASMLDPLIILNKKGRVKEANFASCKMLCYEREELIGKNIQDLVDDIHIVSLRGEYKEANAVKKNGELVPVNFSVNIIDKDNMVCMAHDLTERKNYVNKIKESLEEKNVMIKEIHHRVKNNLQIITSLLRLQSSLLKDPQALASFNEAQNRVLSMALIHEKLYQTSDFTAIKIDEYVKDLMENLIYTYSVKKLIDIDIKSKVEHFSIDTLIPLGLLLNELISNTLKYAFPQRDEGKITIHLERVNESECQLIYKDDGIGMDREQFETNPYSLGMDLIKTLSNQIDGEIEFVESSQGVHFELKFKDEFKDSSEDRIKEAVSSK